MDGQNGGMYRKKLCPETLMDVGKDRCMHSRRRVNGYNDLNKKGKKASLVSLLHSDSFSSENNLPITHLMEDTIHPTYTQRVGYNNTKCSKRYRLKSQW